MISTDGDLQEISDYLTRLLRDDSFKGKYNSDASRDQRSHELDIVEQRAKVLLKEITQFTGDVKKLLVTVRKIHESNTE